MITKFVPRRIPNHQHLAPLLYDHCVRQGGHVVRVPVPGLGHVRARGAANLLRAGLAEHVQVVHHGADGGVAVHTHVHHAVLLLRHHREAERQPVPRHDKIQPIHQQQVIPHDAQDHQCKG